MIMDIDTSKPIMRVAQYQDEAKAYGLPYKTVAEQTYIIIKMIESGAIKEPIYFDATGVGQPIVNLLDGMGVKVIAFRTQMLRGPYEG